VLFTYAIFLNFVLFTANPRMWPNSSSDWQHPPFVPQNCYNRCPFSQGIPPVPPPLTTPPGPFNLWPSENSSDLPLYALRPNRQQGVVGERDRNQVNETCPPAREVGSASVGSTRVRCPSEDCSNREVQSPPSRRRRFASPRATGPNHHSHAHHQPRSRFSQVGNVGDEGSSSWREEQGHGRRRNDGRGWDHEGHSQAAPFWLGEQDPYFDLDESSRRWREMNSGEQQSSMMRSGARGAALGAGLAYGTITAGRGTRTRGQFREQHSHQHQKGPQYHGTHRHPRSGQHSSRMASPCPPAHQHLCHKCGRTFASLTALRQHAGTSHRTFECPCGYAFCSEQAFAMHLEATGHHPGAHYAVPLAESLGVGIPRRPNSAARASVPSPPFTSQPRLTTWLSSHQFHHHPPPRPAPMYTAEELFTTQEMDDMDAYIYNSHRAGPSEFGLAVSERVETGLPSHDGGTNGSEVWRPALAHSTPQCPLCRQDFRSQRALERHLGNPAEGQSLRQYHCHECNQAFCSGLALNSHREMAHHRDSDGQRESESSGTPRTDLFDRFEWSDFAFAEDAASDGQDSSVIIGFLDWRLLSLLRLHSMAGTRENRNNMDLILSEAFSLQTDEYQPSHTVTNLPEFTVKKQKEKSCCSVCLEGLEEGQTASQLGECSHIFHSSCIKAWLARKQTCPVCRTAVAC